MSARPVARPVATKVAAILPRLASDHVGEIVASALAIGRTLNSAGLDWYDLAADTDFVLVVAWALGVLRNRGPYPVIVLSAEQGSAKSTFSAILRALLDPNTAPLRALPREDLDVSGLPAWISETLCRLATGGGFAVRQLTCLALCSGASAP